MNARSLMLIGLCAPLGFLPSSNGQAQKKDPYLSMKAPFHAMAENGQPVATIVTEVSDAPSESKPLASIDVGDTVLEKAGGILLTSFGDPKTLGGKPCRNVDETGKGDGRKGYASFQIPSGLFQDNEKYHVVEMTVWGKSSSFQPILRETRQGKEDESFAWHRLTQVEGSLSQKEEWNVLVFEITPGQLDDTSRFQNFGFGSRDSQIWVSRIVLRSWQGASATPAEIEAHAVKEMRRYLGMIAGAPFRVAQAPKSGDYPVYVGQAARKRLKDFDWASLGDEGFLIRSGPDGAFVAGATDSGTLYGVYTLLEGFGARWFAPGELGEVIPFDRNLRIGTIDEVQKPAFKYRWVENGDWALRNKMNVDVEINGRPVGPQWQGAFHSFFRLIPPEKYYDKHPEWFALVNGKRVRPEPGQHGRQLCTSNPGLTEEMANNIIQYLDEHPDVEVFDLTPQDGGGFCECENCAALDEDRPDDEAWHASYSNRLAVFNNEIARRVAVKHPDVLLKTGAYAKYLRVPLDPDYAPEPNVAVQVCHTYSCNNHPVNSDCFRQRKYYRKELDRWAKLTDHLILYEYYRKGMWGNMPYDQVHIIRHDIPYYRQIGVKGFFTQSARDRWPSTGHNHWVAARLVWDTKVDVDQLLEDFYTKFYGDAAEPMKCYYETLMRAFVDYGDCISAYGYKWPTFAGPEIFTPEVMNQLREAMNDAVRMAETDIVRRRIDPIRVRVEYLDRLIAYLKAARAPFEGIDLNDATAVNAAYEKAVGIGEPLSQNLMKYCRDHGVSPFARVDAAHQNLRFLVRLPGQKPLLQ